MKNTREPLAVFRYGLAIAVTATALILTKSIRPLTDRHAFDLFQGAVFLSALYGGFGPGLLAASLSIMTIDYFLLPPLYSLELGVTDTARLVVFGVVALVTSSLSAKLRQARLQSQQAHDEMERRLAERTEEVLTISNREQQRIGQDIHDGLCQTLTGSRLQAQALQRKLSAAGSAEAIDIGKIEAGLEMAQEQAEAVSRGLYPVELETDGLVSALEELAERISAIYPVVCRFVCRNPFPIEVHEEAVHLFRIAQEAVSNAIKGGKARHITVRLLKLGPRRVLAIADDGAGFSPDAGRKGMGLKIMNYRARAIGAKFEIRPRPKGGTLVGCVFSPSIRLEKAGHGS